MAQDERSRAPAPGGAHPAAYGERRRPGAAVGPAAAAAPARCLRRTYFPITTPHGSSPTAMSLIFLRVAVSITLTLLERPLAT